MKKSIHHIKLIGRREYVDFPLLGLSHIEAKIDTGAYTSSIHCEDITLTAINNMPTLVFTIKNNEGFKKEYSFTEFTTKKIRNSFGEMEERFIIKTVLKIGKKNIRASISLSKRDKMRYPVLIGRKPLKGKFLIDVKQIHTGGISLKKAINTLL